MTDLDHRPLSIPLFVLGAVLVVGGAIGLAVDAASDLDTNNPAGVLATGGILLFAAFAVTALLNPGSAVGVGRARVISGIGALALVLLLVGAAGGAALGGTVDVGTASSPAGAVASGTSTASGLLGEEDFEGSLGGVATPLGAVGGTSAQTHDLDLAEGARALRVTLSWTAGPAGASELALRVETEDGEVLADAMGASELVLDVESLPEGALRLVVSLPEGAASSGTDYAAHVEYYDSAASLPST